MAHLSDQELNVRGNQLSQEMLTLWETQQGQDWYVMQCPCLIDCGHMPPDEIPRLRISFCPYPGEMDFFFMKQPFLQEFGFRVRWHCDEEGCLAEQSCGTMPML